jgi:hypothetical protein
MHQAAIAKTQPSRWAPNTGYAKLKAKSDSVRFFFSSDSEASLTLVSFFDKRKLDTLLLGEGDNGFLAGADAENVGKTGSETVTTGVLNVSDLVGTGMVLDVLEDTDATDIVSSSDEDTGTVLELEAGIDITGGEVELDGVVDVDLGVGVTDGSTVVGHDVGDGVLTDALLLDLAEFELGLGGRDLDSLESSLNVVKDSEGFGGLGDGDDVHEAEGESVVSADLVVHSDVSVVLVSADLEALNAGESVLQSVSEEDREGDALSHLVGTSGRSGSVNSTEFSKVPVLGSEHALHVLFRSSGHC